MNRNRNNSALFPLIGTAVFNVKKVGKKGKAIVNLTVDNYGGVIKDISPGGQVSKPGHFCYLQTSV